MTALTGERRAGGVLYCEWDRESGKAITGESLPHHDLFAMDAAGSFTQHPLRRASSYVS